MTEPMHESRVSYLRRVIPDVQAIDVNVRAALIAAEHAEHASPSDYELSAAIHLTQKLLEDLQRALHAKPAPLVGGSGDPV